MKRTVLAAALTAALILTPTAALANGNPGNGKTDKCLSDSRHDDQHHHFYGWGHCKASPTPTTGGPGPTPTKTHTPKPKVTHSPKPSKTPKPSSTTPTTGHPSTTSVTESRSPAATSTNAISATSDVRSLAATGYPLTVWLLAFGGLVAAGVALRVLASSKRRGERA